LLLALIAGGTYAFFSDTATAELELTTASVEVGGTTGFPLVFSNLVPGIWSGWQPSTVYNASTIPVDLYTGLKHVAGTCDLIHPDLLTVQIQRWDGANWVTVYSGGGEALFGSWNKIAEDMPASVTYSFQTRVLLDSTAGNEYQDCAISNSLFIHAVQWEGGSAPTTPPWEYVP
jgi:predicted ribosomally synthesized peptide with SipW-like signal peptide